MGIILKEAPQEGRDGGTGLNVVVELEKKYKEKTPTTLACNRNFRWDVYPAEQDVHLRGDSDLQ